MKKLAIVLALSAVAIATPALAQQKITVEVIAPAGYDLKKVVKAPTVGYADWCVTQQKGKIMPDPNQCQAGGKHCVHICVGDDGKRIEEPWKAAATK